MSRWCWLALLSCMYGSCTPDDPDHRDAKPSSDPDRDSGADSSTGEPDAASRADATADAAANPNGLIKPRTEERFVWVQMLFGSGFCPAQDCPGPIVRTVLAPGILVLEDDVGVDRFELSRSSYERLLRIVLDPALMTAIA